MAEGKVVVDERKVSCDGGNGALGHPKVYLEILGNNQISCPYCGKLFIYKPSSEAKSVKDKKSLTKDIPG